LAPILILFFLRGHFTSLEHWKEREEEGERRREKEREKPHPKSKEKGILALVSKFDIASPPLPPVR
jgi:hypothetical protein